MIDPLKCVETLYASAPDQVEALLDLFIWSRTATGTAAEALAERIEQFLHSRTDHGSKGRQEYRSTRLNIPKSNKKSKVARLPVR